MVSILSTLILTILLGPGFIQTSRRFFRSSVRPHTPRGHKKKQDMPTMGGLFVITLVSINSLLWCNWMDLKVWVFLLLFIGFGLIGAWDDWQKIKRGEGIAARAKFMMQSIIALIVVGILFYTQQLPGTICLPLFKSASFYIGSLFLLWGACVLVGTSNAVNLTDGLDGLALGSLIPNFGIFTIICYLAGHKYLASYLHIPYTHTDQLVIIGGSLLGASLGFLWFNTYPAQIFMGDVGSLALGGALAYMALCTKQEMLLLLSGGLFVIETLSVIMQVISYKLYGKRIFRMAPIHHHFELLGWPESRITTRFGIISLVLCLLALMMIKIR